MRDQARTVPEKSWSKVTPGARRDWLQQAMTQIDSGLVRKLVCVDSQALVRNGRPHPRGLLSNEDTGHCARISHPQRLHTHRVLTHAVARTVKRDRWGCDLLPLRKPHRLRHHGLRELAPPRETSFNKGTELP